MSPPQSDRPLALNQIVADMIEDKLVNKDIGEQFVSNRRSFTSKDHPLVLLANQKWKDLRDPRKLLTVESLTQWLAARCNMEYVHIDPFKVGL